MTYNCPKCRMDNTDPEDIRRKHCSFCDVFAEDLRGELVTELQEFQFSRGLTRRDCFSVAFWTVKYHGNEESRVVHGRVRHSWTGELVEHAWAETPGKGTYVNAETGEEEQRPLILVVDYCQVDERARFLPRDFYYEQCGVELAPPPKRYTIQQCMLFAVLHGNDGPWDDPGES
jgi:hypothetical protein